MLSNESVADQPHKQDVTHTHRRNSSNNNTSIHHWNTRNAAHSEKRRTSFSHDARFAEWRPTRFCSFLRVRPTCTKYDMVIAAGSRKKSPTDAKRDIRGKVSFRTIAQRTTKLKRRPTRFLAGSTGLDLHVHSAQVRSADFRQKIDLSKTHTVKHASAAVTGARSHQIQNKQII